VGALVSAFGTTDGPAAVLGTLAAFEIRYDYPAVFAPTPEAGAALVERCAWYCGAGTRRTSQRSIPGHREYFFMNKGGTR